MDSIHMTSLRVDNVNKCHMICDEITQLVFECGQCSFRDSMVFPCTICNVKMKRNEVIYRVLFIVNLAIFLTCALNLMSSVIRRF